MTKDKNEQNEVKSEEVKTEKPAEAKHEEITKKDRHHAILRWMCMGGGLFNFETQQGSAVAWSLSKILRKIYPKDDEYIEALDNHFQYFGTNTTMAGIILGATTAMEAKDGIKAKEAVQAFKTSLMGPFSGIGDTLIWILFPTIMGSISGYMALNGNPLGAIVWILLDMVMFWIRIKLFDIGYDSGTKLIDELGERMNVLTDSISALGLMVVGTLISTVVKVYTPLKFQTGKAVMYLQSGVLDKIMPALLPLALTFGIYKLLDNKFWTPTKIILLLIAISLIGSYFGILGVPPTK